jgi:hypothetical protein
MVTAAVATAATAVALASPITPAQHTVNVVPPPPAKYSSAEIQAAKDKACSAWDTAARATARSSKVSATTLETSPNSQAPESADALAMEKRTGIAAVNFLRTNVSPATPLTISEPIGQWIAASIDEMHAMNQRDWAAERTALTRGNELVDVIAPACGLR